MRATSPRVRRICWASMTSCSPSAVRTRSDGGRFRGGPLRCPGRWSNGYVGRARSAASFQPAFALREKVAADVLEKEIARYDPRDAATVSQRIRSTAGRDAAIDQIIELYQEVVREFAGGAAREIKMRKARAEAAYLRDLDRHFEAERNSILQSRTFRWRKRMLNLPIAGPVLRAVARRFWE